MVIYKHKLELYLAARMETLAEFSERSGVSLNTLHRAMRGDDVSFLTVGRIAQGLNVPPCEITKEVA